MGEAPTEATKVSIESLAYSMNGGKNSDRHIFIDIIVLDDLGAPVAGASMGMDLNLGVSLIGTASGSTDENGWLGFSLKNADTGCYSTVVTNLTADGLTWDTVTPENQICK